MSKNNSDMPFDLRLNCQSKVNLDRPIKSNQQENCRNTTSPCVEVLKHSNIGFWTNPSFFSLQRPKEWNEICVVEDLTHDVAICNLSHVCQDHIVTDRTTMQNDFYASANEQICCESEMCFTPPLSPSTSPFQTSWNSGVEKSKSRGCWSNEEKSTPPLSPSSSSSQSSTSFSVVAPSRYFPSHFDLMAEKDRRALPYSSPSRALCHLEDLPRRPLPTSAGVTRSPPAILPATSRPNHVAGSGSVKRMQPPFMTHLVRADALPTTSLVTVLPIKIHSEAPAGRMQPPSQDNQSPAHWRPQRAESGPAAAVLAPATVPPEQAAVTTSVRADILLSTSLVTSLPRNVGGGAPVRRMPPPPRDSQLPARWRPRRAESAPATATLAPATVPPEQAELRAAFKEMVRGRRDLARAWIRTRSAEASVDGCTA